METYFTTLGLTDVSDAWKRAILIHSLGTEGQRILATLRTAEKYADCVTRPGESVHQYVANLSGMANLCKFGTLQDELIRDQLAEHTNNPRIPEKSIMSPDDLTVNKAVEIAFQIETA